MSEIIKSLSLWGKIEALHQRYATHCLSAFLFCLPLKLSLAYLFLFPLILTGISSLIYRRKLSEILTSSAALKIWYAMLAVMLLSAPFGIMPLRTISQAGSLFLYSLSIPVILDILQSHQPLRFLLFLFSAQAIAGLHSIYEFIYPQTGQIFIGTISESGQLALTLPLLFGVILANRQQKFLNRHKLSLILLCTAIAFAALLLNLKRGPWSGVLLSSLLLAVIVRCRLCLAVLVLALAPVFFFTPLQERILQSSEHFFISGGRSEIWAIGSELIRSYPLGIGYGNSAFLQKFSLTIPAELKHFHNNFLNIFVETGVLGICLFTAFLAALLKTAWQKRNCLLTASAGAAVLSNQIAGIVEYNFGDSEVMLLAYFVIALILCRPSAYCTTAGA